MLAEEDLTALIRLAERAGCYLLVDEPYRDLAMRPSYPLRVRCTRRARPPLLHRVAISAAPDVTRSIKRSNSFWNELGFGTKLVPTPAHTRSTVTAVP